MKTREQLEAAMDACVRAYLEMGHAIEPGAEMPENVATIRRAAAQLAWALDIRDYPDFDFTDRFFNRLIAVDEQACTPGPDPDE
jgi:hypothetical protein